jgi:hypothetical protein
MRGRLDDFQGSVVQHEAYVHQAKEPDNFRTNTRYGRTGAAYNMIGFCCFNQELLLLPKNPTHLQSCTIQLLPDAILLYLVLSTCAQRMVHSESTGKGIQIHEFQFNR